MKAFDISQAVLKEFVEKNKLLRWTRIKNSDYKININGQIVNKNGKLIKSKINHNGYETIVLKIGDKRSTCRIHRLLAQAYLPNPLNKPEVHHIDGNKRNNNLNNLMWSDSYSNRRWSREVLHHSKIYSYKQLQELYTQNKNLSLKQFFNRLKKVK